MTISTLILVLLLTFGAACALDRLARSLRMLWEDCTKELVCPVGCRA
jgi:hypothetical protein